MRERGEKKDEKKKRDSDAHRGVLFWWKMQTSAHLRCHFSCFSADFRNSNSPAFRCEPRVPASGAQRWTEVSAGEPAEEPAAPPW